MPQKLQEIFDEVLHNQPALPPLPPGRFSSTTDKHR
jgi:hypothetical protein